MIWEGSGKKLIQNFGRKTRKKLAAWQNWEDNIKIPSFPSALQLRVSFGLLNNLPPFFSIPWLTVWFLNNLVFYGVRLLASRPTPNMEDQGIPLRLAPTP
jgi:hypothetical protein